LADNAAGKAHEWLQQNVGEVPDMDTGKAIDQIVPKLQRHLADQGISIADQKDLMIYLRQITEDHLGIIER
jgi:hypothetical protein